MNVERNLDERSAAASARRAWILLALIAAAALWVRLWGITFGLPYNYHVDEALYRATASFTWAKIHPHFGPFQILVLALQKLLHLAAPLVDALPLSPAVAAALGSAMSFQVLGRTASALLGAATVVPLFLLGRRLWNQTVGLTAAFLLAFCFLHARSSHYGVPDAMSDFLIVMAAYFCSRLSPSGSVKPYLWAGLFAGLALPTKQLSWPIFVLLLLFHLFPEVDDRGDGGVIGDGERPPARRGWLRALFDPKLIAAYALATVVFLVTSPQVVLHTKATFAFWKYAAELGARGGMDRLRLDDGPPWRFYLVSLGWGLGWLLTALALAGVVLVFVERRARPVCLMICFPVLYVGFLLKPGNMYFARYILGTVPFLLLAAAALLWAVFSRLGLRGRPLAAALSLAAIAAVAQPAYSLILHDRLLEREDTRTVAKRWIEENVPDGSTVLLESWWFSPQLATAAAPVPFSRRTYKVRLIGPYGLSEKAQSFGPSAGTPTVQDYADQGVEYIVTNSLTADSRLLDPAEDRAKTDFYRSLDRDATRVFAISPGPPGFVLPRIFDHTYGPATFLSRLERPGPRLAIYRLPPAKP